MDRPLLAARLRALHEQPPLVLSNAWGAGSARVIEAAGAAVAGIGGRRGRPDGQRIGAQPMLASTAGADCVVPGVVERGTIREPGAGIPGPLDVVAGPDAAEPAGPVVASISVGPATDDDVDRARELPGGCAYGGLDTRLGFADLNGASHG